MGYRVPSFRYPGGKARIRKWLVRMMPHSGRRYVEPCAGRGNVFWLSAHMLDFQEWHLNDPWTGRWFEAIQNVRLRDIPDKLSRALVEMYRCNLTARRETDDVAVALESMVLWAGGDPCIDPRCHERDLRSFKNRILRARNILNILCARITSEDWQACGLDDLDGDDFVYFDPPYMKATIGYYRDKTNHERLVKHLVKASYLWMVSGYSSPLYIRHLGAPEATKRVRRWICITSGVNRTDTSKIECVWTNYSILEDGSVVRKSLRPRSIRKKMVRK